MSHSYNIDIAVKLTTTTYFESSPLLHLLVKCYAEYITMNMDFNSIFARSTRMWLKWAEHHRSLFKVGVTI